MRQPMNLTTNRLIQVLAASVSSAILASLGCAAAPRTSLPDLTKPAEVAPVQTADLRRQLLHSYDRPRAHSGHERYSFRLRRYDQGILLLWSAGYSPSYPDRVPNGIFARAWAGGKWGPDEVLATGHDRLLVLKDAVLDPTGAIALLWLEVPRRWEGWRVEILAGRWNPREHTF